MKFLERLFPEKRKRDEAKIRRKLHPAMRIQARISGQVFLLTNFSEDGISFRNEGEALPKFTANEKVQVEFLIHGYRKSALKVEIRWSHDREYGAKVLEKPKFAEFVHQYLRHVIQ